MNYILSIDQGTSSTKTLIFDAAGNAVAKGSEPLQTNYFDNGFVEQDAQAIYENVLVSVSKCLDEFSAKGLDKNDIVSIGISNQRETFVVWDEAGEPLHPAIVWQCKRSVKICERLAKQGLSEMVKAKTGLVIDPYFSATKLSWLSENNASIRHAIANGLAFFGTIDTWLLYKLTGGEHYTTDHTNASRTLFFNLQTLQWDNELIEAFGLKGIQLPAIQASSSFFGSTSINHLLPAAIPIHAMIGDSHAAAFGEGCFEAGTAKATLGTGCSILMNIGEKPVESVSGMVTTICWSVEGRVDYALEGVIVSCGATIEWLKNELQLFAESRQTETMANAVDNNGNVYIVPAFSGLGSPHWQMDSRASITGLSFGTTKNHIVRAALESIPYQVKDVIAGMEKDADLPLKALMVNGGISANQFVLQFLANLLNKPVVYGSMPDVSALGAAFLAGLYAAVYKNFDDLKTIVANKNILTANGQSNDVQQAYLGWQHAVHTNINSIRG